MVSLAWYWVAQTVAILVVMFAEGDLRQLSDVRMAATTVSLFPAVNAAGWIPAVLLLRPRAHARRWPPYVLAALAGAATVANIWMVQWAVNAFDFSRASLLAIFVGIVVCFMFAAFCTAILLLLLYRAIIDRDENARTAVGTPAE
jgi:hypothetical protein